MDIVFIKQLQVDTVIGVYDWEKTIKQRLVLDITLAADQRAAANNDDIRLTLDYAVITEKVITLITAQPIELIETVAERVAQRLGEPVTLGGHEHVVTGSIGISIYPDDGGQAEELLRHAGTLSHAVQLVNLASLE